MGPAAEYDVFGIPLSILMDRDGKVVAVDVRGHKLDEMIARTLNATDE